MANSYLTTSEFKTLLQDSGLSGTSAYDTLIGLAITDASRAIDRFTKREPGAYYVSTSGTRYFDGSGNTQLWIGELAAAPTSVSVAESGVVDNAAGTGGTYTAWSTSDYQLWPYNALAEVTPYLRLDLDVLNGSKSTWYAYPKAVKIAGKFGYATVLPDDIKMATAVQAIRYFKRAQQAFQDAGAVAELSQLHYVKQIDPDVSSIIEHYVRMPV